MTSHTFYKTIAFKLTLWFTGIFSVCAAVAFILFYMLSVQTIQGQIDQELLDNTTKFITVIRRAGLAGARELAVIEAQAAGEKQIFFRLLYPSGEVFASSHMSYWKQVKVNQAALQKMMTDRVNVFETITVPDTRQKARILYSPVAANAILQSGVAMEETARFLSTYKKAFAGIMGFILVFSAFSGWMLVQKALAGVKAITQTAADIGKDNLDARVRNTGSRDELDLLADTFNHMLDRIESLVKSIREMSDNIAHDLKSPVTRIRGFAELSLTQEETLENYRNMAANTIEESDRLLDMINTMLLISRADAGEENFYFEPVNLSQMISGACELFLPLAEDKHIDFGCEIQDNVYVRADIKMLQRAAGNLLDNAIKYTPEHGSIRVSLEQDGTDVCIRVEDTGFGIEPEYHEKIFERFFRTEASRTTSGTGLGLSLARSIARKHKGDITVTSAPLHGSVFKLTLPISNIEIMSSSY